jgi:FKBP-type peptidyl-prolyl cis-trans isomerase FklB
VNLKPDVLLRGIQDAMGASGQDLMGFEQRQQTLIDLRQKAVTAERWKHMEERDRRRRQGAAFLAEKAKKEGVVTLPSGLRYKVIAEGKGKSPEATDSVTVNYRARRAGSLLYFLSRTRGMSKRLCHGQEYAGPPL